MSITTTGYSLKRFEDIIAELRQDLITASGDPNLDLSDDSLLGIINNIYGLKFSELHELAQALWSAGDVDTATGIALDRIVERGRIYRQTAAKSYGTLEFTSTFNTVVPAGTQVRDLSGATVATTQAITLNNSNIQAMVVTPNPVNSFNYFTIINGATYSYVSDANATAAEIVNGLVLAIEGDPFVVAENISNTLKLTSLSAAFNVTLSSNLSVTSVTKSANSEALVEEFNEFEIGTLNRLVVPNPSLSVTNNSFWISGRDLETDSELRERFKISVTGQGRATVEALRARVAAVPNVTKVFVEENVTLVTSVNGLPPKSFEVTVKGGSNLAVAQSIWETKPAGIQSHGNVTSDITDTEGNVQTIFFTRPTDQYIHVKATYQLYNEELFPSDGAVQIAQAIQEYGQNLNISEDVIAQRIMAAIYSKVTGIGNLLVEIGKTSTPTGTPIYTTGIVPIGKKEESIFDLSRITIIVG